MPAQTTSAPAQDDAPPVAATESPEAYRLVRSFDFNERPLGNYEDTPMYWRRMTGEGLPSYSSGRLDEQVGHDAPPSFLCTLKGGNIGYEYERADLLISPNCDYLVEGYILAEGLEFARALIACYAVDKSGARIPGSDHVSQAIASMSVTGSMQTEPWQRVEIPIHVAQAGAYALHLQLWVLQDYALEDRSTADVDPIIRQEVDARVWFDDVAIIRMPRMRLWCSDVGGIIRPGARETLHLDIHNATLGSLAAELQVTGADGTVRLRRQFDLSPRASDEFTVPLPDLPPGLYRAEAQLISDEKTIVQRALRFAVLPELAGTSGRGAEFGVDLGRWPRGLADGATELTTTLGCGAVKVGVPMTGAPRNDDEWDRLRQLRELAKHLMLHQIETTGVILSPTVTEPPVAGVSTYRLLTADETWEERVGPIVAYIGANLSAWQLGCESIEVREPVGWDNATINQAWRKLERFAAIPHLIVPRSIFDADPARRALALDDTDEAADGSAATSEAAPAARGSYASSFWLPATVPARAFPWQLAFWSNQRADRADVSGGPSDGTSARWLSLGLERDAGVLASNRITDLARRIVLARAVNPERLYVPAPFELTSSGGETAWQPTDEYIPLRTLLSYLAGQRTIASLALPPEGVALLFGQGQRYTLVVWTWEQDPDSKLAELCVGPAAIGIELNGSRRELRTNGPVTAVPLAAMPLIISNVNGPLLLLQQSFRVEPTLIQVFEPGSRPVLSLYNPYAVELVGTIELRPPPEWSVTPNPIYVQLAPGESLAQPLEFEIPPRQIASGQELAVDVHLGRPEAVNLRFDVRVEVGLKDLGVTCAARWEGDDLIVEQSLRNLSSQTVSFNAFCQPPQRAQLEGVFLNVLAGEVRVQTYRVRRARELAGTQLWMGVQEIGGRRTLDQLVVAPR